ncbi:unnamed protein product [Caenorhabditis auriculariae]|uniref:Uncharacterized protein n=1 Tax=Caenorhabditis auriculariae TaxID=2777116 RepID=A0A8S1HEV5_9PELO|nr:unnamed protein product [Caenorhabditis auriculariae]
MFAVALLPLVAALGGKPFVGVRQNVTGKNYALISLCDDIPLKPSTINVSLVLKSEDFEHTIHFRHSKEPILLTEEVSPNVSELFLTAEASPEVYSIQKVTVRIGAVLYKLHLNQECDEEDYFMTSPTAQTFWSRRLECERKDVYCDDRRDEFLGCEPVFVYHMNWRRGATRRNPV